MTQILKDDRRALIVNAAINDFYEYGYQKTSMRHIAKNANMTVGNVYRYFKNKDDLINYIIEPVLRKINEVLVRNTNQVFNPKGYDFDVNKLTYQEFYQTFDDIAVELCQLYYESPRVFIIVLKNSLIHETFLKWWIDIIYDYILFRIVKTKSIQKKVEALSRMYGVSLFSAVQDFFFSNHLEKEEAIDTLKFYFKSYISLIEFNFRELEE